MKKHLILFFVLFLAFVMNADAQKLWRYAFLAKNKSLPIKKTRTLSFQTDEASFMNIDVSPDGKTILFDILGDIYQLPVSGGEAIQITRGMAMCFRPTWSPDGSKFACLSDANGSRCLQVRMANGKLLNTIDLVQMEPGVFGPILLTDISNFAWLPDGENIIYPRVGMINVVSGGISPLLVSGGKSSVVIKATGEDFFLVVDSASARVKKLKKYNGQNGAFKNLVPGHTFFSRPDAIRISPDQQWAVYPSVIKAGLEQDTTTKLMLLNLETGQEKVLVKQLTKTLSGATQNWRPSEQFGFSPDSRFVYVGYGGKIHQVNLLTAEDRIIPFTAKVRSDLGPLVRNTTKVEVEDLKVKYIKNAHMRSDGKQLVFAAVNKIYVMDLPSGKPKLLADQSEAQFSPRYSPDGKWIAYVTRTDTAGGYLWKIPSDGGKPVKIISEAGRYCNPNWSSSGNKLVCIKAEEYYNYKLVFIDPVSGLTKIHPASFWGLERPDMIPQFSTDEKTVYVASDNDNRRNLKLYTAMVAVEIDSIRKKEVSRHLAGTSKYHPFVERIILSKDNKWMVFSRENSLFVKPFDANRIDPDTLLDDTRWTETARFVKNGQDPYWSADGKRIGWSYGNRYFEVEADKVIAAFQQQQTQRLEGITWRELLVKPDKELRIDLEIPKLYGKGMIALMNARIISIKGDKVIPNGMILVKNGRIQAVQSGPGLKAPAGAEVLDLSGKTIMPGLVDVHDHIGLSYGNIIPQQDWRLLINLAYGTTTAIDPSTTAKQFAFSELLETGSMVGPRLYSTLKPIDNAGLVGIASLEGVEKLANDRSVYGGRVFKEYKQLTRLTRQWTLMAAKRYKLNMTNEASRYDYYSLLSQFKDGSTGVEHQYEYWDDVYKDIKKLIAWSGTWFTPTLGLPETSYGTGTTFLANYYRDIPDAKLERFTPVDDLRWRTEPRLDIKPAFLGFVKSDVEMLKDGALITMGSHGNIPGLGMHLELFAMHLGGMANLDILRCATLNGARTIGLDRDLGSIEKGKVADLIILDKNPLEDIENTRSLKYVMKNGVLYNSDNLEMLWPVKKPAPKWN